VVFCGASSPDILSIQSPIEPSIIVEFPRMMLARRRSQEFVPSGNYQLRHNNEITKDRPSSTITDENIKNANRIPRRSRLSDDRDLILDMLSNVRPSSAITATKLLRHDSVKTDLKKATIRDPFHKKLEVKVIKLIEQRKRLVSRLQE